MTRNRELEVDFFKLKKFSPELSLKIVKNASFIKGNISIIDEHGYNWGTFNIEVTVPKGYPYVFPSLREVGGRISKEDFEKRHINPDGTCCVAVEPVQYIETRKGIRLDRFFHEYVDPFLANQIVFELDGEFIHEYAHGNEGIIQYFEKITLTKDKSQILKILRFAMKGKHLGRNHICFCDKGKKYKLCHFRIVKKLWSIGIENLQKYEPLFLNAHSA